MPTVRPVPLGIRPLLAALLVVFLAVPALSQGVRWRAGPDLVPTRTVAERDAVLALALASGDGAHVVVQLDRTPNAHTVRLLETGGLTLLEPLGEGAFFAAVSAARLDPRTLSRVDELVGVALVDPRNKLHADLADGAPPAWSVVTPGLDPVLAAYVIVQRDVSPTEIAAFVAGRGGRVVDVLGSVNGLVVETTRSEIDALAARDDVQWIEPPLPPLDDVWLNDSNSIITQANTVQAAPYGLDGSGVSVLVYDGGSALSTHDDFGGRLTVRDASSLSDHATHVSATIGGSGVSSGGTYEGMAPGVTIESYGFESDGSAIFLYTNPGDFEADYGDALNTYGADVANNSIGTNTETNGFPCNIQGDYGIMGSLIDAVARGSLGEPLHIVWANGNERQGSGCDVEGFGDYYSTAPPATAKNHITVGALNSNDDSVTSFTSWGPTDDGRMKPDVSAPGCQTSIDFGVTSASSASNSSVTVKCGTSMSSPTTTGLVALLLEDHRAQFGAPDPLPATVKILLAHAAADIVTNGPDYQSGYGSLRIQDTIDFMRQGFFDESVVDDQGGRVVYTMTVSGGAAEVKVTMAWDDVPGTPNVFGALVNDLDLVVVDPNGTQHFPWTLDPSDPGAAAVRTQRNALDNIEQVLVDAPVAGAWTIEVRGTAVASGPQTFSVTGSHAFAPGPYIDIGFPSGTPTSLEPGVSTAVQARIAGVGEGVVGGTPTLHVRLDSGAYLPLAMTALGGDLYEATFSAACSDVPEFYVSATGTVSGATTSPADAPTTVYAAIVEQVSVLLSDDFETDAGWTVTNTALDDGAWELGVPAGLGGRADPVVDFDGSGQCWLTDNVEGNSDVDGGPTSLTSPSYDLSGATGVVEVSYAAWFANNDFDIDVMVVEVSDDGGSSWATADVFGNTGGWQVKTFRPADFVAPTNDVVLRFTVSDNPNDSILEAAIDALLVTETTCVGADPWTDLGCALAGVAGDPLLAGSGPLTDGSGNQLEITSAAPDALAVLFFSASSTPVPFKGGTLKTWPILTSLQFVTSPSGSALLPFTWGPTPSFSFTIQAAFADAAAVFGVSLSNAVRADVP